MSEMNIENNSAVASQHWIAVDWGTSHLRAWKMHFDGSILDTLRCDKGMNSVESQQFETVLLSLIAPWLDDKHCTSVLACGMLGSRQGWVEVSYLSTPCAPNAELTQAPTSDARIQVYICPGVKQLNPADVMRGEETQVAGFLATNPYFSGVICLPGTHAKWVKVSATKIEHFQTFLTGELYGLLAKQSVLRHSIDTDAWHTQAFCDAIEVSLKDPASVSAKLFSLRAQSLLENLSAEVANARLSGYLIGLELAASRNYWHAQQVIIIGDQQLAHKYADALSQLQVDCELHNSETMTLQGLSLAYRQLFKAL